MGIESETTVETDAHADGMRQQAFQHASGKERVGFFPLINVVN
jgi:hypothetical protein